MEVAHSMDDIYTTLKAEIIDLSLKPGSSISEHAVCQRFGVSRTPVRTALQKLEGQGFVSIVPYKGTTVTRLNYQVIDQDIYARVAVETAVLRDFIRIATPGDREAVRFAYAQLEQEGQKLLHNQEDFDTYRFLHTDIVMHNIWFGAINKMTLAPNLEKMDASYVRFLTLDINRGNNVADVLVDHRELMEIVDSGEVERIEGVLRRHLYGNVRRLGTRLFTELRDYFEEGTLPA